MTVPINTTPSAPVNPRTAIFDQPQNPAPPRRRVFCYAGEYFEDPGPEYSIQDILGYLARTYPELEGGAWTSRELPDGSVEITFVKVTGEKGRRLTPAELAALLIELPPAQLPALDLVRQVSAMEKAGQLGAAQLLALAPHIETALAGVEKFGEYSQGLVKRCLALVPTASTRVPLGF